MRTLFVILTSFLCAVATLTATPSDTEKLKNAQATGEYGFILNANNDVIKGTTVGRAGNRALFKTDGEASSRSYLPSQLSGLPLDSQLFIGGGFIIHHALDAAENAVRLRLYVEADRMLKEAALLMNSSQRYMTIPDSALTRYNTLWTTHDEQLAKIGQSVYEGRLYNREILNAHLSQGDILFKDHWIQPDQLCAYCSHTGTVPCLKCVNGTITEKCPAKCNRGRLDCRLCKGTGKRDCQACNGTGKSTENCTKCDGAGRIRYQIVNPPVYRYVPWGYGWRPYGYGYGGVVSESGSVEEYTKACPRCHGTGKRERTCKTCDGKGYFPCAATVACQACYGAGVLRYTCPDCRGKTRLQCSRCAGLGWIPKAIQPDKPKE